VAVNEKGRSLFPIGQMSVVAAPSFNTVFNLALGETISLLHSPVVLAAPGLSTLFGALGKLCTGYYAAIL
jgi:hypothetical protein